MRPIDADELWQKVRERFCDECVVSGRYDSACRSCGIQDALDEIEDAPTVGTDPVQHGRWKAYGINTWQCTACQHEYHTKNVCNFNYCPHCGAKMVLEDEQ